MYPLPIETIIMTAIGAATKLAMDHERENRKLRQQLAKGNMPTVKALDQMQQHDKKLVDTLNEKLNLIANECDALNEKLNLMEKDYEALKTEHDELKADYEKLRTKSDNIKAQYDKLKASHRATILKQKQDKEKLQQSQQSDAITSSLLIKAFEQLDTLEERKEARRLFNDLLSDNETWKNTRLTLQKRGFFRQSPATTPTQVYIQDGATAQFSEHGSIINQPAALPPPNV